MSLLDTDSANWTPVPMSIIMMDYCSSTEEVTAFVESMKDVIIYVEARRVHTYGRTITYSYVTENICDILTIAGVRINKSFTRNTTHVIFENGRLETYRKAKRWNIPLVNELWFEACMRHHRVCDPTEFPISCLERYENPAEHVNIPRWMDPYAEPERKRARMEP